MKRYVLLLGALAFAAGCSGGNGGSGSTTGSTGNTSGSGGTGSSGPSTSSGSGSSGPSSSSTGSNGGSGGNCTEITASSFKTVLGQGGYAYQSDVSPALGGTDPDVAQVSVTSDNAGTFDLSTAPDNDPNACVHCVLVGEDLSQQGPAKLFFQTAGSFTVTASNSDAGSLQGSLANVTLRELDLNSGALLDGGACLHLASATIDASIPPAPQGWTCPALYYGDGTCDCGCGIQDSDCANSTDAGSCDYCDCASGYTCDTTNTTQCDQIQVPATWTCDPTYYSAGDGCDCGCGALDPDCTGPTDTACDYCDNCGSADADGGCVGVVQPTDNSQCIASATTSSSGSGSGSGSGGSSGSGSGSSSSGSGSDSGSTGGGSTGA